MLERFGAAFDEIFVDVGTVALALSFTSVLLAGFIRGFVGFGSSLVIVMVLGSTIGPKAAVAVAALSGVPSMIQLLPTAVRLSERAFVIPFAVAVFVAAPVGTWVLVYLPAGIMKVAISIFVLAMIPLLCAGWRMPGADRIWAITGTGIAAGLIQGAAGIGGPPAVALALARTGPTEQQRANVIGAVNALGLCGLIPLWYYGLFTTPVILLSLLLVPPYLATTWLGARFFSLGGQRHYRNAALLLLTVIGLITLGFALLDFLVQG